MLARAATILTLLTFAARWVVAQEPAPKPASTCTEWKAWHNVQPRTAPATLNVCATGHFPTVGYAVELVPVG
jgi:hypothetical protein